MSYINLRVLDHTAGCWLSFTGNHEGIFLSVGSLELALIWPWTKL